MVRDIYSQEKWKTRECKGGLPGYGAKNRKQIGGSSNVTIKMGDKPDGRCDDHTQEFIGIKKKRGLVALEEKRNGDSMIVECRSSLLH